MAQNKNTSNDVLRNLMVSAVVIIAVAGGIILCLIDKQITQILAFAGFLALTTIIHKFRAKNQTALINTGILIFASMAGGVIIAGGIALGLIDEYTAQVFIFGAINVIVALSLNLISGFTGQLALGHAGFMAIGAYSTAIFVMQFHVPLLFAIFAGGLITAVFGLAIGFPCFRLRGDYLAIVTLGFGEIIRVIMINLEGITGGAAGLKGIPPFSENILVRPVVSFIWIYVFLVLVTVFIKNLIVSSPGRAIISIREDEIAAGTMGVNVFYYKMFAFTVSAFIAGIGGGLYAPFFGYLNPTMFDFIKSVNIVVIVVLGGMGSITGTVITGFILSYLQEFLRFLQDFRMVFYALLLIIIMLFKDSGLMGTKEFSVVKFLREFDPKKINPAAIMANLKNKSREANRQ